MLFARLHGVDVDVDAVWMSWNVGDRELAQESVWNQGSEQWVMRETMSWWSGVLGGCGGWKGLARLLGYLGRVVEVEVEIAVLSNLSKLGLGPVFGLPAISVGISIGISIGIIVSVIVSISVSVVTNVNLNINITPYHQMSSRVIVKYHWIN
ncbi:hypothetical protein NEUTE1DRAFT_110520 [Neurospora tetrasperma FGSC 2508]|uniref:Uncharacterized protein n=1 Tax=Neurospora tetrasperma (strain FGSC 2508 / ATCC MYA-4615 / P0657) TaxID=510951 RepID=F8MLD5_NEUT8|nr:uncharacterized protein NEUTE1DRAFT_110520 [Neurospora tetrasperma FGSC 2508]EGO58408.1 hypothetical protein NEUTE1DRAFT_110520 [Neurospora tetrasperma FGSC 2508]EGZ71259.1 hypothetical protein NEUTE2DRAFT_128655 [Neurospora tetrasperma FGSC 2509]